MKLLNPFKTRKLTVNKVYENKSNGQWMVCLPRNKLKKFNKPPTKLKIIGYWEK